MSKGMFRKPPKPTPRQRHEQGKCDVCRRSYCPTHCNNAGFVLEVLAQLERYGWTGWGRKRTLVRFLELGARLTKLRDCLERLRDVSEQDTEYGDWDGPDVDDAPANPDLMSRPHEVPVLALVQKGE
jgi:hypothetical protein